MPTSSISVFLAKFRAARLANTTDIPVSPVKTIPVASEPVKPKEVKQPKVERIPKAHLDYLKTRAKLHVRELCTEFFPDGRLSDRGYWITPELRISVGTGCFWRKGSGKRPTGDILALWLLANDLMPSAPVDDSNISRIKFALTRDRIPDGNSFRKGAQSLSAWLERFPAKSELHELTGYDS